MKGGKQDLRIEHLSHPGAAGFLATLAQRMLNLYGSVTFVKQNDDNIIMVNPLHVYLDAKALDAESVDEDFEYVKPIIGSGSPTYAAMRNGQLWEIKFKEKEDGDKGGDKGGSKKP